MIHPRMERTKGPPFTFFEKSEDPLLLHGHTQGQARAVCERDGLSGLLVYVVHCDGDLYDLADLCISVKRL